MVQIGKVPSTSENPSLRRWRVIEVRLGNGACTRHLLGHDVTLDEGRASSSITGFDRETMTVTTHSGRIYTLVGVPGRARKSEDVWRNWCKVNGVVGELDVTHEYFSFTIDEDPAPA